MIFLTDSSIKNFSCSIWSTGVIGFLLIWNVAWWSLSAMYFQHWNLITSIIGAIWWIYKKGRYCYLAMWINKGFYNIEFWCSNVNVLHTAISIHVCFVLIGQGKQPEQQTTKKWIIHMYGSNMYMVIVSLLARCFV